MACIEFLHFESDYVTNDYVRTYDCHYIKEMDLVNQLIWLNTGIDEYHPTDDIYTEVRTIRALDETLRVMDIPVTAQGRVPKGGGTYTSRLAQFLDPWHIVPDITGTLLLVQGEQISDIGTSGSAIFDFTYQEPEFFLAVEYAPPDTEIVEIDVGGGSGGLNAQEVRDAMKLAPTAGVPAAGSIDADLDTILTDLTSVLTDLNDGSTGLPAIKTSVDSKPSAAEVNAELVDVLEVDTHIEPTSVVGAAASIKDALMWLKIISKNKMLQTETTTTLRNTADTLDISTSLVSDDDTTFTRGAHQ